MACVLLSNLGASITEVAKDGLVTEYGQKHRITGLHSYAFMALAAGGILGNLLGDISYSKAPPKIFLASQRKKIILENDFLLGYSRKLGF